MQISFVIPAHNRPELLTKAIGSIYQQNYRDMEVIVIDDGSEPAIDVALLQRAFDKRIRVIRNPDALGIGRVREMGSRVATGDLIWQLDDDDLLAADAISTCIDAFNSDPDLDVLFVNIGCFGRFATHRMDQQEKPLAKLLSLCRIDSANETAVLPDQELLPALLTTVPQAFQHPVARKQSSLRIYALFLRSIRAQREPPGTRVEELTIPDDLNEAEWAIYASAICSCAYLSTPLYLMRCDDQGYFSIDTNRNSQGLKHLELKRRLFDNRYRLPELRPWGLHIRRAYSRALRDLAYLHDTDVSKSSFAMLSKSFAIFPSWEGLKMLVKLMLTSIQHTSKNAER